MIDFKRDSTALIVPMAFDSNNPTTMAGSSAGVAGAETIPSFGNSLGRDLIGRVLPPLLAVSSVIVIWWALYLIYPRQLPWKTIGDNIRLALKGAGVAKEQWTFRP